MFFVHHLPFKLWRFTKNLPRPFNFCSNRPLSSEDLYFYYSAIHFQKTSDIKFLYLNKLTVEDTFSKKDRSYRKIHVRTINKFFQPVMPPLSRNESVYSKLVLCPGFLSKVRDQIIGSSWQSVRPRCRSEGLNCYSKNSFSTIETLVTVKP